jgi:hypothetical protein
MHTLQSYLGCAGKDTCRPGRRVAGSQPDRASFGSSRQQRDLERNDSELVATFGVLFFLRTCFFFNNGVSHLCYTPSVHFYLLLTNLKMNSRNEISIKEEVECYRWRVQPIIYNGMKYNRYGPNNSDREMRRALHRQRSLGTICWTIWKALIKHALIRKLISLLLL